MTARNLPPESQANLANDSTYEPEHPALVEARRRMASYPSDFFVELERQVKNFAEDFLRADLCT